MTHTRAKDSTKLWKTIVFGAGTVLLSIVPYHMNAAPAQYRAHRVAEGGRLRTAVKVKPIQQLYDERNRALAKEDIDAVLYYYTRDYTERLNSGKIRDLKAYREGLAALFSVSDRVVGYSSIKKSLISRANATILVDQTAILVMKKSEGHVSVEIQSLCRDDLVYDGSWRIKHTRVLSDKRQVLQNPKPFTR